MRFRAAVDDPPIPLQALDKITTRKQSSSTRPVKAFNPLARSETPFFAAAMRGEHAVLGFTNRDLRDKLARTGRHVMGTLPP